MASEALGFPSTSFMNHSSSSIYNLLGISVRVYVFFFHSFSTIQAETYASLPGFCNMPCFHRRHLAQRSDECLQLHSTRYGKSRNLWTFTHVDLANFGNGGNSWRQWPTLYLVALFTIFQYISYILLDLTRSIYTLFYIWMIPKSHHEYWILASLNAIWNFLDVATCSQRLLPKTWRPSPWLLFAALA